MSLELKLQEPTNQESVPNETQKTVTDFSFDQPKKTKPLKRLSIIGLVLLNFLFFGFAAWQLVLTPELISPLSNMGSVLGFKELLDIDEKPNKIVMGYLPYWNFKHIDKIDFGQITHLAIFGVLYEIDGGIQTREADYMEPGWRNVTSNQASELQKKVQEQDTKVVLTLTSFDNDIIEAIVLDPEAKETMINETTEFVKKQGYDGINMDFEYVGNPEDEVRVGFTELMRDLTNRIKLDNPEAHVSVAVYADSADNNRLWEVDKLGEVVDHIMIMAYDFHRQASETAGPVAPMYGGGEFWRTDIATLLEKHLSINEPNKLILGVPFYGYEWRTRDQEFQSPTFNRTGRLATYQRVNELFDSEATISAQWNATSLTPWLSYQDEETEYFYQIHYDDTLSLSLKYDFVNQTDLAGIGIWALGYEGDAPEMWELIKEKF